MDSLVFAAVLLAAAAHAGWNAAIKRGLDPLLTTVLIALGAAVVSVPILAWVGLPDRKSTRLNSSHGYISYAAFCLKKKTEDARRDTEEQKNATVKIEKVDKKTT